MEFLDDGQGHVCGFAGKNNGFLFSQFGAIFDAVTSSKLLSSFSSLLQKKLQLRRKDF